MSLSKLKTLKDIEDESIDNILLKHYNIRLKAEAIKWVKDIKDYQKLCNMFPNIKERMEAQRMNDGARMWIVNFFNLTEEDLNDSK